MKPKRAFAIALVTLCLGALAWPALHPDVPIASSLSIARKFWAANRTTRLMNSTFFRDDAAFVLDVLAVDARLPLGTDVVLVLAASTPNDLADGRRRRAAYLLAPRRVIPVRGQPPPGTDWLFVASPPGRVH